ncbi:protease complex subunit PrcB family protein [Deinococcus peraridilitoris]|uniref:PrcB C-terminal domain-containing protein n=1 Tax=Deinococcus peraridilitoris (strain DSM 19664 / LMG 22246 / CIP 109416 / KR-200) TaxID=937777 RepID=L0A5T0_DEIPD|nr:protease complex subunit PrcB family protein [Deinococcus peraridilitoris]AFZ68799.1 hypothetical protein Deipe_3359 [Deinococcus peraridilitoris DSM 19664]
MNKQRSGLFLLSAVLLGACSMNGPNNFEVHEALLYGASTERIGWVYGSLNGVAQSEVKLGEQQLTLRPQVPDPLAINGTLSINGRATLRTPTSNVGRKVTVSRENGMNFIVQANANVEGVYFTDGTAWYKLSSRLQAGSLVRVSAQEQRGLRGAGKLTEAEADALANALQGQGQLAVAVIPEAEVPDAPLKAQPEPKNTLRTALFLQSQVNTATTAAPAPAPGVAAPVTSVPAPRVPAPVTPAPATPPASGTASGSTLSGGQLNIRELGRGAYSAYEQQQASVRLARSPSELGSLWSTANGNVSPPPAVPSVTFASNSVVAFFLGQRPTGGYGVRVLSTRANGTTLMVTVEVTSPGEGAITTQALTSPWVAFQVPGTFQRVVVQDPQGRTLAQTN